MTSQNTSQRRRETPLKWLTLAAAAARLQGATDGDVTTQDQLLQLCADGVLPLTLRLDRAIGVAWTPEPGKRWPRKLSCRFDPDARFIDLVGLFDVGLQADGVALIEAMRREVLGLPPRGWSGSVDGRIQVIAEDGSEYALLEPAQLGPAMVGASRPMTYIVAGVYDFASAKWPLSRFTHAEPVIRTSALTGWTQCEAQKRITASTAAVPAPDASTAAVGSVPRWSPERIADARAMRDHLQVAGRRDYTKRTAEHYGVSASFLRRMLTDDTTPPRSTKLPSWVPGASRVHRLK